MNVEPFPLQKPESQSHLSSLATRLDLSVEKDDTSEFSSLLKPSPGIQRSEASPADDDALRKAFTDFVGQTLFGQWIASMRSTQGDPAYMHGGQAERIFQNQLDQVLAEEMTKASADSFANPMYELFQLRRSQ
jgi:hypothetical protein